MFTEQELKNASNELFAKMYYITSHAMIYCDTCGSFAGVWSFSKLGTDDGGNPQCNECKGENDD